MCDISVKIMKVFFVVFSAAMIILCGVSTADAPQYTEVTAYADDDKFVNWDTGTLGKPEKEIGRLNDTIGTIVQVAGTIVIALGIINIIMAFADQNMQSKTRGALLLAGGIALMAIKIITKAVSDAYDPDDSTAAAKEVLTQIGTLMQYVGVILLAFGIIQCILAYINMASEEKANGLKGLVMGISFLGGSVLMNGVKTLLKLRNDPSIGNATAGYVVKYVIGRPASYIGIGLAAYGIIQIIIGFKDEDAGAKHQGAMTLVPGIALLSFLVIFNSVVNMNGSNVNYVMDNTQKIENESTDWNKKNSNIGSIWK